MKLKLSLALSIALVLTFISHVSAGQEAAAFLGPKHGTTLILENNEGVRVERKAVRAQDEVLTIEERSFFPAELTPDNKHVVDERTYELLAEGPQLIHRRSGREAVFLDLAKDSWTVPLIKTGSDFLEMKCSKVKQEKRKVLGQARDVIDVVCTYSVDGENAELHYTLAAGLGLIRMASSDGDNVANQMVLTEIKQN